MMRKPATAPRFVYWLIWILLSHGVLIACTDDDPKPPEKDTDEDIYEDVGDTQEDVGDTGDIDEDIPAEPSNVCIPAGQGPPFKVAERADLRWKRVSALEFDLLTAMKLGPKSCGEIGLAGVCFSLHRVPLGGNDPVANAMYQPLAKPTLTSSLSFDRVVVALCGRRADEDHKAALDGLDPQVFTHLDWSAASVDPDDPKLADQITVLYQRLLGRDPDPAETAILLALAEPLEGEPITPREFAKTACFTVATTTEMILN
jgi:hypothetical protein